MDKQAMDKQAIDRQAKLKAAELVARSDEFEATGNLSAAESALEEWMAAGGQTSESTFQS